METVGTTKNGKIVYVDLQDSHAATHIADTPGLLDLVKEFIAQFVAEGDEVKVERDGANYWYNGSCRDE